MSGFLAILLRDTDDTRDSSVPKLVRYIEREVPKEIYIHEPNIKEEMLDETYINYELGEVLEKCTVLFYSIEPQCFYEKIVQYIGVIGKNTRIIDYWNVTGNNQIVFHT